MPPDSRPGLGFFAFGLSERAEAQALQSHRLLASRAAGHAVPAMFYRLEIAASVRIPYAQIRADSLETRYSYTLMSRTRLHCGACRAPPPGLLC